MHGRLNDAFTAWVGALPLTSLWLVLACDVVALLLVAHALRRRRHGYYWWQWPLAALPAVFFLGLLFALNAQFREIETVADLVQWMR